VAGDPADELTFFRVAGNNGILAGFGGIEGLLPKENAKAAILLYATMARDTMLVEDRLYLGAEVGFSLVTALEKGKEDECGKYSSAKTVHNFLKIRLKCAPLKIFSGRLAPFIPGML
jgi:hypothetical protein